MGGKKADSKKSLRQRKEDWQRESERETCLRSGDSFVLCLCMSVWECWGL